MRKAREVYKKRGGDKLENINLFMLSFTCLYYYSRSQDHFRFESVGNDIYFEVVAS